MKTFLNLSLQIFWTFPKSIINKLIRYHQKTPYVFPVVLLSYPMYAIFLRAYLYFISLKNDTLPLTNIGFAMFVGLASVMFTWGRSIEGKYPESSRRINKMGALSILGSILFSMASIFKYFSLYEVHELKGLIVVKTPDTWIYIVSLALIFSAIFVFFRILLDFIVVFLHLWKIEYSKTELSENMTN